MNEKGEIREFETEKEAVDAGFNEQLSKDEEKFLKKYPDNQKHQALRAYRKAKHKYMMDVVYPKKKGPWGRKFYNKDV